MWKTVKISELCEFQSGLWKGKKGPLTSAYIIRNTNFRPNGNLSYENIAFLEVEAKELSKRKLQHGDIILEKSGGGEKTPVGRVCLFEKQDNKTPYSLSNFTCFIRIKQPSVLNYKYLHKFLYFMYETGKTEPMQRNSTGIRNLQLKEYKNISITLPPITEQKRIVAKLESSFAEIDKIIFTTQLNTKNTMNAYQKTFDNLFEKESKKNVSIGDFSKINYGYTSKSSQTKGSHKILRITDIQKGVVNWDTVPMCEVKKDKLKNVLLYDGDIVFARTGATTGKSHLLVSPKNAVFASYLIRLSVDRTKFLPKYIYHYFQSSNYWKQINEGISGAAQGGFNAGKLSNLQIPLIDIKKQEKIIEYLDNISYETKNLTNLYQLKVKKLIKLKLSILKQKLNKAA